MADTQNLELDRLWLELLATLTQEKELSQYNPQYLLTEECEKLKTLLPKPHLNLLQELYTFKQLITQEPFPYNELTFCFEKIFLLRNQFEPNGTHILRQIDLFILSTISSCPFKARFFRLTAIRSQQFKVRLITQNLSPALTREELILAQFLRQAYHVVHLELDDFLDTGPLPFQEFIGKRDWQNLGFLAICLENQNFPALVDKLCAAPAINRLLIHFTTAEQYQENLPYLEQLFNHKPELNNWFLAIFLNGKEWPLNRYNLLPGKRNYFLYSCGNTELINQPTAKQKEHLIDLSTHFKLLDYYAQFLAAGEPSFDADQFSLQLRHIQKTIKEKKPGFNEEPELQVIYNQLEMTTEAFLPPYEQEEVQPYYALLTFYFKIIDSFNLRNQTLQSIILNVSTKQKEHAEKIEHEFFLECENLQEKLKPLLLECFKILEESKKPQLGLVVAACASLYVKLSAMRHRRAEDISKTPYPTDVSTFFEPVLNLIKAKKIILKECYFSPIIYSGLIHYVSDRTLDPALARSHDPLLEQAFQSLIDLVTNSSNRFFQVFAFNTICCYLAKTKLLENNVYKKSQKIDAIDKLGEAIKRNLSSAKLRPVSNLTPFAQNLILALNFFHHNQQYMALSAHAQGLHKQIERKTGKYHTLEQELVKDIAKEKMREPEKAQVFLQQLSEPLQQPENFSIENCLIQDHIQLRELDLERIVSFDPTISFLSPFESNAHICYIFRLLLDYYIAFVDAGLEKFKAQEIVQADKVNHPDFKQFHTLVSLKKELTVKHQEFGIIIDKVHASLQKNQSIFPRDYNNSESIKDYQETRVAHAAKLAEDYKTYSELLTQIELLINQQEKRYSEFVEEFQAKQQTLSALTQAAKPKPTHRTKKEKKSAKAAPKQKASQKKSTPRLNAGEGAERDFNADIFASIAQGKFEQSLKVAHEALVAAENNSLTNAGWLAQIGLIYNQWIAQTDTTAWDKIKNLLQNAQTNFDKALALCEGNPEGDNLTAFIKEECEKMGLAAQNHRNKRFAQAKQDYEQFRLTDALASFTQIYQDDPRQEEVILALIRCLQRMGDYEKALEYGTAYLARFESDELTYRLALLLYKMQRHYEAETVYRNIKNKKPNKAPLRLQAEFLFRSGKEDELRALLDNIIARSPNKPSVLFILAWNLQRLGNHREAQDYFKKLLRILPHSVEYRNYHAQFLIQQRKFTEAEHILNEILKEQSTYVFAQFSLAECHARNKKIDLALAIFDDLLHQYGSFLSVFLKKLDILLYLRMRKEADLLLEEIIKKFPKHPDARQRFDQLHSRRKLSFAQGMKKNSKETGASQPLPPAVNPKAQLIHPAELQTAFAKINLPAPLTRILTYLKGRGNPYIYGPSARQFILRQTHSINKIHIVFFTNEKRALLQLLPPSLLDLKVSATTDDLYTGQIDIEPIGACTIYIYTQQRKKDEKSERKIFTSSVDSSANSFLIDATGQGHDELSKASKVFCEGISEVNAQAITQNPLLILHHIFYHHEYGTLYGPKDGVLIAGAAKKLAGVYAPKIMHEIRKAITSKNFKNICNDWIQLGIFDVLLPKVEGTLIKEDTAACNNILASAENCQQRTDDKTHTLMAYFFSKIIWQHMQKCENRTHIIPEEYIDNIPLFSGLNTHEREQLSLFLREKLDKNINVKPLQTVASHSPQAQVVTRITTMKKHAT